MAPGLLPTRSATGCLFTLLESEPQREDQEEAGIVGPAETDKRVGGFVLTRLAEVCVEPGEDVGEAVEAEIGGAGAGEAVVGFGRVADEFDGAAEPAEGGEE